MHGNMYTPTTKHLHHSLRHLIHDGGWAGACGQAAAQVQEGTCFSWGAQVMHHSASGADTNNWRTKAGALK